MEIIRIPKIVQDTCKKYLMKGRSIGFVPTMGALHDGHMSLVKRSKNENDITTVSIFVNPVQFGPGEDFEKYPRPLEDDIKKLKDIEIDILFLPDNIHIYPERFSTYVTVEKLSERLCGEFRPGHFRGVATIVAKLLNIVCPTRAYFGQKDFQQTVIIKRMANDLNFDTEIVVCPTIREQDGLAMSSRNSYLTEAQRNAATVIYRSLLKASEILKKNGNVLEAKETMIDILKKEPLVTHIDYASIYDTETLQEINTIKKEAVIAIAARIGNTRLIDNIIVNFE